MATAAPRTLAHRLQHASPSSEVTMLPGTSERVPRHTSRASNERIRGQMVERLAFYARHPEQIEQRLRELDREWDIERTLQANGSVLAGAGVALAAKFSRWWLLLPGAVLTFCLQHALQGWCPPLPLFRRLGFRTQREIQDERTALLALRGDVEGLAGSDGDLVRVAEVLVAQMRLT
jgi:hypothetical protein